MPRKGRPGVRFTHSLTHSLTGAVPPATRRVRSSIRDRVGRLRTWKTRTATRAPQQPLSCSEAQPQIIPPRKSKATFVGHWRRPCPWPLPRFLCYRQVRLSIIDSSQELQAVVNPQELPSSSVYLQPIYLRPLQPRDEITGEPIPTFAGGQPAHV